MTVLRPEVPGEPGDRRIKLTLTEFLSARLDEYERDIEEVTNSYFDAPMSEAEMWADLDAKRRIVEWCESHARHAEQQRSAASFASASAFHDACRALTLPYADHPDCQEEWKP